VAGQGSRMSRLEREHISLSAAQAALEVRPGGGYCSPSPRHRAVLFDSRHEGSNTSLMTWGGSVRQALVGG